MVTAKKKVVEAPKKKVAGTRGVESEAGSLVKKATAFLAIENAAGYKAAAEFWQKCKAMMKKVDESFDPIISSAYKTHQEAIKQKKIIYDPLDMARRAVKTAMSNYDEYQKRVADEAKKKLEEAMKEELGNTSCLPPVKVEKDVPKVEGGPVFSTVWKAEVVDFPSLVAAVAAGMVAEEALMPNMVWLRSQAVANHEKLSIPGVRAYSDRV